MRILIAGDSLALPRPENMSQINNGLPLLVSYDETYGQLLEKKLLEDKIYDNVSVLNRAQRFFNIKNIYNQFLDHAFSFTPDVIVMQVGIVDCWFREELNGKQLIEIAEFTAIYHNIIDIVKLGTFKLIIIGICPTSRKMENRTPGLLNEIDKYNNVLKSSADDITIYFIDMKESIAPDNPHEYLHLDDHHLNKEGNKLVAQKLHTVFKEHIYMSRKSS